MDRRQFLALTLTLGLTGLAGCGALTGDNSTATDTLTPVPNTPTVSGGDRVQTVGDAELPIPLERMNRALPPDGLLAIEEPEFGQDWGDLELTVGSGDQERTIRPRLSDDEVVIGVARNGASKAYPLRVLNWHEIVNDRFGDEAALVTYCPLCASGMTAVRRVAGEETVFGVSGLLWRDNLVMYDQKTRSLWSQVAATGIHGPEWGQRLSLLPSALTTWSGWRDEHPESTVLLPPPHSRTVYQSLVDQYEVDTSRDYTQDPYDTELGAPAGSGDDAHPLTLVVGVAANGEATAYPLDTLSEDEVVNDEVGGQPVVVASRQPSTLVAYTRLVDGDVPRFKRVAANRMRGAKTAWAIDTGRAASGRYEGASLNRANALQPLYLQAWEEYYPETTVHENE